ncbi:MAG: HupE/UreJ family protein [Flavobacteriia bacterium]|nr:MAG: HupE/UreJ family protein [Flavobacteriia bacterium]
MDDFIMYIRLGLFHVLDLQAYDHILFLTVLAVIYIFSDWKKVLWLITFFTFGHTLTLALSAYDILHVKMSVVEFLIPVTIMATALANIFFSKKLVSKTESNINLVFAFFFGLIHGLGFSSYFKILVDRNEAKLFPLLEFALGIEMAQVVIVILVLLTGFIFMRILNVNRRDWILVISSVVAGIVIPMLFERVFW